MADQVLWKGAEYVYKYLEISNYGQKLAGGQLLFWTL